MVKIRKKLKIAQDRHKRYTDKGKITREFRVGDHVYLKVKLKKISLKLGICPKITPKYRGPFEILAMIGTIAYEIAFPVCIKVHNMFHVSLLKKNVSNPNTSTK